MTDQEVLLKRIRTCAQEVSDQMKKTSGGDAYVFEGSMNDAEDLKEALDDMFGYDLTGGEDD